MCLDYLNKKALIVAKLISLEEEIMTILAHTIGGVFRPISLKNKLNPTAIAVVLLITTVATVFLIWFFYALTLAPFPLPSDGPAEVVTLYPPGEPEVIRIWVNRFPNGKEIRYQDQVGTKLNLAKRTLEDAGYIFKSPINVILCPFGFPIRLCGFEMQIEKAAEEEE